MEKLKSFIFNKKNIIILTFIIILGLVLRIVGLYERTDGLSYDEVYSWWVSTHGFPFGIIKKLCYEEYHPCFYSFLLHFWAKIFGDSDISLRWTSVLASIGTVVVGYFVGKEVKDTKVGLLCAFIMAISVFNISMAQYVRFYPFGDLLMLVSILFALKIQKNEFSKPNYAAFIIANVFLINTLSQGSFFVFIETLVIFLFIFKNNRVHLKPFLIATGITLFLSIPELILLSIQFISSRLALIQGWEWYHFNLLYIFYDCLGWLSLDIPFITPIILYSFVVYKMITVKNFEFNFLSILFTSYLIFIILLSGTYIAPWQAHYSGMLCNMFIVLLSYSFFSYNKTVKIFMGIIFLYLSILSLNWYFIHDMSMEQLNNGQNYNLVYKYLKNNGYDKDNLVFNLASGTKIAPKYDKNNIYMKPNIDNILLYYLPKEECYIFDKNPYELNKNERERFLYNFVRGDVSDNAQKAVYNSYQKKLKVSNYFLIVEYINVGFMPIFNTNISFEKFSKRGNKAHYIYKRIINNEIDIAMMDSRMKYIKSERISDFWIIYIFKKVSD
ncbi:MAG: glycosyltransferase family 39 protein [Candidatus Gastranaerophilales bacterium]|nr:glycosyltransferase family 39 protein [Candidatus Gastranaerophilales bacterium]